MCWALVQWRAFYILGADPRTLFYMFSKSFLDLKNSIICKGTRQAEEDHYVHICMSQDLQWGFLPVTLLPSIALGVVVFNFQTQEAVLTCSTSAYLTLTKTWVVSSKGILFAQGLLLAQQNFLCSLHASPKSVLEVPSILQNSVGWAGTGEGGKWCHTSESLCASKDGHNPIHLLWFSLCPIKESTAVEKIKLGLSPQGCGNWLHSWKQLTFLRSCWLYVSGVRS